MIDAIMTLATAAQESTTGAGGPGGVVEGLARDPELLIPITAIAGGCMIAIVAILCSIVRSSHRERSRREIAAYVAEGSMTPEQAERLLEAGNDD